MRAGWLICLPLRSARVHCRPGGLIGPGRVQTNGAKQQRGNSRRRHSFRLLLFRVLQRTYHQEKKTRKNIYCVIDQINYRFNTKESRYKSRAITRRITSNGHSIRGAHKSRDSGIKVIWNGYQIINSVVERLRWNAASETSKGIPWNQIPDSQPSICEAVGWRGEEFRLVIGSRRGLKQTRWRRKVIVCYK